MVDLGETTEVRLQQAVPVYLVYLSVWMEPDGQVHFRKDVYGRDQFVREPVWSAPQAWR